MLSIRQISDPILHKKPFHVNFNSPEQVKEVKVAIQIMQNNLYEFGGVGIAANQCEAIVNPPHVIIAGTNHPQQALKRYPNKEVPTEIIMINLSIKNYSSAYYPEFGEGCLSVRSPMRAQIKRFRSVDVEYDDIEGNRHTQTFHGFLAHIIQHEYDHLQGLVYLQKAINELTL